MTVQSGRLPAESVRRMFDRIAPVYDAMNRAMTAGLDRRWRRLTVAAVVRPGDRVAMWALRVDVPASSPITATQLTSVPVQVPDPDAYWSAS